MAINSLSSSSKGLSGLASGMDTQAMVDAMLKGTQNKIDSAKSKKAQLTYKQEMYRSVSAQLRNLKSSFFSFTNGSSSNMYSTDFFRTMAAKTSSSAFRVTAGTKAAAGNTKVDYIEQLARAKSLKSTNVAAAALEGEFNVKGLEQAKEAVKSGLTVAVGDTEVKIEDLNALIAGKGSVDAAQILNDKFADLLTGTDKVLKVSFENGEMKFEATNTAGEAQSLNISGSGTKIFATSGNEYSSATGVISKKATLSALDPSLFVTLNGVRKTITFDYNKKDPKMTAAESVATSLQTSIDKAFGPGVTVIANGDKISFKTESTSSTLMLQGGTDAMKMLGIKTGQSNKINSTMNVGNINFATELTGNNFQFKINGVDFNITADKTLDNIISQINSSDANVKISYSRSDDKFIIEAKQAGKDVNIEMSQSEGNLLSALFGKEAVAGSRNTRGEALYDHKSLTGTYDADKFMQVDDGKGNKKPFTGGGIILEINGKQVGFPLPSEVLNGADGKPLLDADGKEQYVPYTAERFKTEINKQLEEKYGKTDAGKANIAFSVENVSGNDVLKLNSERGYAVGFSNKASAELMGFVEGDVTTKAAKADTKLSDLGLGADFEMDIKVGGQNIKINMAGFSADATIKDLTDKINDALRAGELATSPPKPGTFGTAAFDDPPGRFRLFGVDVPMEIVVTGGENAEALFGGKELSFGDGKVIETIGTDGKPKSDFIVTEGQNAVLSINGVKVERNSNVFNYDGLDFELLTTTHKKDANGEDVIGTDGKPKFDSANIDVTRDTEKIYSGLVKFVEEYNKVMDTINKLLSAEPNYKEYAPLTSEQRAQMSESEAKLWDEKSKEGLLRRDPALEKVMTNLRNVLYSKPGDSDLALYNIGIKTFMSYDPNDSGKLQLDGDGATLKKMIAERPDDIAKLFLSDSGGLSKALMDAIDSASANTTGSQGTLVKIAGATGTVDTSSNIYKQLKGINDSLSSLERTYQSEYTRYWRQFTNMEQMIANMNSQSSWLTQQSGS